MGVIDERGRLFGRFNAIDAIAVVIVFLLMPMSYVAYRVFRVPPPVIRAVTPAVLSVDPPPRIRLEGEHFRPYLNAFVGGSGEPFSITGRVPESVQAKFLIETPSFVELQLPKLAPGAYDLYLYDEGREVARKLSAFRLTAEAAPQPPPEPPVEDTATLEIVVRFDVDNDIVPLITTPAVDLNLPAAGRPAATPATLVWIKKLAPSDNDVRLQVSEGGLRAAAAPARTKLEGGVRLGVTQDHGVWIYSGPQRIRAGEGFGFATSSYVISGLITRVAAVHPVKRAGRTE